MIMRRKAIIFAPIIIIVSILTWNLFNEPGIKDLKGNFKEQFFLRNEQNDGPVIRLYIVSLNEGDFGEEMKKYGDYMPHTKYGTTKVFFFKNTEQFPTTINLTPPHLNAEFMKNCIGIYEKDGMGQTNLKRFDKH